MSDYVRHGFAVVGVAVGVASFASASSIARRECECEDRSVLRQTALLAKGRGIFLFRPFSIFARSEGARTAPKDSFSVFTEVYT
jgi:hypothetical protein